ncbi:MAG TPA: acyl carrier protein [Pseudonocardiaceae bacterium]|jgi:acyl carrier protein|nr:acyl carrier protein [Pseudonocardiaceae bacterium]
MIKTDPAGEGQRYQLLLASIGDIVREVLHRPELVVSEEANIREELGLDSADVAELIVEIEARTGVPLPDDLLEPTDDDDPLATVGSLASVVAAHSGQH